MGIPTRLGYPVSSAIGGTNGQLQYNNNGVFGGIDQATFAVAGRVASSLLTTATGKVIGRTTAGTGALEELSPQAFGLVARPGYAYRIQRAGTITEYSTIGAALTAAVRNDMVYVQGPATFSENNLVKSIVVANTSLTRASSVVTVVATAHGFAVGDRVAITGADASFCGEFVVATKADSGHFTYICYGSDGVATTPGYSAGVVKIVLGDGVVIQHETNPLISLDSVSGAWIEIVGRGEFISTTANLISCASGCDSTRVTLRGRSSILVGTAIPAVDYSTTVNGLNVLKLDLEEIQDSDYHCLYLGGLTASYIHVDHCHCDFDGSPVCTAPSQVFVGQVVIDIGVAYAGGSNLEPASSAVNIEHDTGTVVVRCGSIVQGGSASAVFVAGAADISAAVAGSAIIECPQITGPTTIRADYTGQLVVNSVMRKTLSADGTIVVPAGHRITGITIRETASHAVTGGIKIGTTSGAIDVVVAQAVASGALVTIADASILLKYFSATAATTLYVEDVSSWNSASINVAVSLAKVE